MVIMRFVWFRAGCKAFAKEVNDVLNTCLWELECMDIHRGPLGLRWLCVANFRKVK